MPAQVKYKVVRNYLDITIAGKGQAEHVVSESAKVWKRINEICESEQQYRVLARMQMSRQLPIRFSMDIAKGAQQCGWSPNYKLAFITNSENHMTMQLIKSFMRHLGYEVEVFSGPRTARRWLTS